MDAKAASELLDLVAKNASRLRREGVLTVQLDGLGFTLAPAELPPDEGTDEPPEELDVLSDPATYGRTRGVPGRQRKAPR